MRDHFWGALHTLVFKQNYLERYYKLILSIERTISVIISITSAASVASWAIWDNLSIPWAAAIMIAQLIQIIWPLLPFSKQITGIKYHLADLNQIILDAEMFWYSAENEDAPNYIEPLRTFRQRHLDSENRYLGVEPLPVFGFIYKRAEELTIRHLQLFFGANEGSESDGVTAE